MTRSASPACRASRGVEIAGSVDEMKFYEILSAVLDK